MSLPLWERGLKFTHLAIPVSQNPVAPSMGAWIEILPIASSLTARSVAPSMGAWIEISQKQSR